MVEQNPPSEVSSGHVRSLLTFFGISSIHDAFIKRTSDITIPHTKVAPLKQIVRVSLPQSHEDQKVINAAIINLNDPTLSPELRASSVTAKVTFSNDPGDGLCWYCHRPTIQDKRVGIPLRCRDDRLHHILIVDTEGIACTRRCAFAFLVERMGEKLCYDGRLLILRQIHEILEPGNVLKPAPNFRMLKMYGGPLTDEEFDEGTSTYVPIPTIQYRACGVTFSSS